MSLFFDSLMKTMAVIEEMFAKFRKSGIRAQNLWMRSFFIAMYKSHTRTHTYIRPRIGKKVGIYG